MKTGKDRWGLIKQVGMAVVGLAIILAGVGKLLRGKSEYPNYWGGIVFVPFAILVGGLVLYVAVFRWGRISSIENDDRKGRAR